MDGHRRGESSQGLVDSGSTGEALIPVGYGLFAIVDSLDCDRLHSFTWHAFFKDGKLAHVYRYQRLGSGKYRKIRLHHAVMGRAPVGSIWDHRNGNVLDNRRRNLRTSTHRQNLQNARVRRIKDRLKPKTSMYKGVSCDTRGCLTKPWRARIRVNGGLKNIGWFATEKQAAVAYNEAATLYFGEFAAPNEIEAVK